MLAIARKVVSTLTDHVDFDTWFGLFGPAALPKDIAAKLHAETLRIMENADLRERLAADGGEHTAMSTEQFAAYIRADAARWAQVIRTSGATAD